MRRVIFGVMALVVASSMVGAGELAKVTMPDQVTVSGKTLQLNGMGLRKKMMFKIYVAGLYLEQTSQDAAEIVSSAETKRVVMHFTTNKATKKRMDEAWVEGFEANSPEIYKEVADRVTTFIGYFGDMKDGDVIELTMVPGEGTAVALNGEQKGVIEGDDFSKALLLVWLGDKPPTEDLQKGMLGLL